MWLVIGLGIVACAFTLIRLQPSELGWRFALISVLTLGFGSRVVVQIPRVKGQISVSDTFIFLVLLLFGCASLNPKPIEVDMPSAQKHFIVQVDGDQKSQASTAR